MFLKVQAAGFLFYKILVLKDILLSSTGQFAQKRNILSQNGLFRNFISKQLEDFLRFFEYSDCFRNVFECECTSSCRKQSIDDAEKTRKSTCLR